MDYRKRGDYSVSDLGDLKQDNSKKTKTVISVCKVILIVFIGLAFWYFLQMPALLDYKKRTSEWECIQILNEIRKAEKEYFTIAGNYGPFEQLSKDSLISCDNKQEIIEKYNIVAFNVCEMSNTSVSSSFTIVAIPDDSETKLRTFAINQDNNAVLWIGEDSEFSLNDLELSNRNSWIVIEDILELIKDF